MNFTILRFDTLESTNTEAVNQARRGADEGVCVIAARQTAGRGRHGRTWISDEGAGLYFSIVLRPVIEKRFLPLITLTAAVAVADTLRGLYDLKPDIKWVNDILIKGKKISGILAEMTETEKGAAVIVGIGINLRHSNFPPEIAAIATSIEAETLQTPDLNELVRNLTRNFDRSYRILQSANGPPEIIRQWSVRSSYASGKAVRATLANEMVTGVTDGLEETGALRVKTDSGEVKIIQTGDVESLR